MVKGLYAAYTGMLNEQKRMDVLTNNLANSATTGFKKEGATSQAFDTVLAYKIKDSTDAAPARYIGKANLGVKTGETYTDYTQGAFKTTGNTYDLALSGSGFFTVAFTNKAGETSTKYTRDGSFTLNTNGYLVTKDGDYVLNTAGSPIRLDPLQTSRIDEFGTIYQNDRPITRLLITDFADYNYLEHYGENYYQPVAGATQTRATATVHEGYLEASNVQVVSEMVDLISTTRAYESNQKLIQTIDGTLDVAVNRLGKL
ncbi:MAG: flagellar hook-basal body protein [Roseburia sp.]|nr:flagellar hook-basal body protein [Roseburia sp.]MCM1278308.1 flagellar hook-basal body protein [Robinsoniella sp.]